MASNSYSLDYWRKLFHNTNTNIFEVVENALLVAAADHPAEFARRRDELVERIFTCQLDRHYSWRDRMHDDDDETGEIEREKIENKVGSEPSGGEGPSTEVEEVSRVVDEITRIKKVLKNWCNESESVLLEPLQRLQSMEISLQILEGTKIGKTVKHLIRHESEEIQLIAHALIDGWRNVVKDWANELANNEAPYSLSKASNVDEGGLAFPPWDEAALLTTQTTSIELTRIFDGIDDNGNSVPDIETCGQSQENGRRRPAKDEGETKEHETSSMKTRPLESFNGLPEPHCYGEKRRSETSRQLKLLEAPRPPKPYDEGKRRLQESHNRLPKLDDLQRKNNKLMEDDSGPSVVPGRPPRTAFEHKAGAETKFQHNQGHSHLPKRPPSIVQAAPQQYDDWSLAQEKLENAKRKLHEGYKQAENAKRQRTIQVVELSNIPKHSQNQRQPTLNVRDRIMKKLVRRH